MSESVWYFAYGSNMSARIFVERRGMQPSITTWGWIDGYRLSFDLPVGPGERGVATIVAEVGARTCGVLYQLTVEEAERLDNSEGVPVGLYRRLEVGVTTAGAEDIAAFTYLSSLVAPGRKPSPRYMGLLLDGAQARGLPAEYVAFLHSFTLAHDERPAHVRG